MDAEKQHVIFGVYDSYGNLMGYKSDSFWTLDFKKYAKLHGEESARPDSYLIKSLVSCLNMGHLTLLKKVSNHQLDRRNTYYVVAQDSKTGEGVMGVAIRSQKPRFDLA